MDNTLQFEAGFESATAEDWKLTLVKDLKGVTFEDLTSIDRNGIAIAPFYTKTDSILSFDKNPDWYIMDCIQVDNDKESNSQALNLLNNGITGLQFSINSDTNLEILLNQIDLKYIHLHLKYSGKDFSNFKSNLQQYLNNNYANETLSFQISKDAAPFTLTNGQLHINAAIYNNAGCNAVTEVALCISQLNEALHQNTSLDTIKTIYIQISVDTWYYEQIAKLRALRILAQNVLDHYQVKADIFIAAETSCIYLSDIDIYSNILRNAIAGMAASIGGADSLYIQDFTLARDSNFTGRISRNQQLLFKEESYFDLVNDKSKGSYFIENYSQQIAEKAWTQFQTIEEKDGWQSQIDNGSINEMIELQAQLLINEYKEGKRLLIGVNKYQVQNEQHAANPLYQNHFGIKSRNIASSLQNK